MRCSGSSRAHGTEAEAEVEPEGPRKGIGRMLRTASFERRRSTSSMKRAQQTPRQITLLRDSKSRFGFMIGVETAGFVVKGIAPTDALPPAGTFVFDERDQMSVGDLVLSVGVTPLVDEHGLLLLDLEGARSLVKDAQGDSIVLMVQPYNRAAAAAEKAATAWMVAQRVAAEKVAAAAAADKAAAKEAAEERAAEQQAAVDNAVAEKWAAERAAAQKAVADKAAAEEAVAAAIAAERSAAQKTAAERAAEDKAVAQKAERVRAAAAAERAAERAATERAAAAAAAVAERAKAQKVAAENEAAAKVLAEGRAAAVQKAAAAAVKADLAAGVARSMPRDRTAAFELDAPQAASSRRTLSKRRAQVALSGKDTMQVTLLRDAKSQFGFAIGAGATGIVVTGIAPNHALPLADRAFDERNKLSLGDVVLSVGVTLLVNERGQRIAGVDLDHVRSLVKDSQGDSIVLTVQRNARTGSRGKERKTQPRSSWFARWLPGGVFNAGTPFERALRTIVMEPFGIALRVKLTDVELVTNGLSISGNTVEIRARPTAGGTSDQHWCQVAASLPVSAHALGLPSLGRVAVEVHVTLMSPLGLSEAQKTVQLAADLLESSWPEGDAAGSPVARELASERLQRARRARRTRNTRGAPEERQSVSAVTIEAMAAQMHWLHKRTSEITGVAIPSFALPATASALPQDGTAVQLGDTMVSRL